MAKHVILERYTFTPSTKTVVVSGKNIRAESLLLITNVTTGTVIYNFSDPTLGATSISLSITGSPLSAPNTGTGLETTTIVLEYDTTAMSSTDKLAILIDELYHEISPSETMRDPVDKLRVSEPQALIDTDFEYGVQNTKWETINLLQNRATAYYLTPTRSFGNISNVTVSGYTVNVVVNNTLGITAGSPIFVQGTTDPVNADGWWQANVINTNVSVLYNTTSNAVMQAGTIYDATKTILYPAAFYSNAAIPMSGASVVGNGTPIVTVTTTNAHCLQPGDGIYLDTNVGILSGSWTVNATPTTNTFQFVCNPGGVAQTIAAIPIGSRAGTAFSSTVLGLYPRPLGYVVHRAFDGGVQFTNQFPWHGYQVIRQTRRYFRYQSGKGIQFSTGSALKPQLYVDGITSAANVATVLTRVPHGLQGGANVRVSGSSDTAYNGVFTVTSAPNNAAFTYTTTSRWGDATGNVLVANGGIAPTYSTAPGFPITVTPFDWYGSQNRVGMFDQQNGAFFEFDGQTIWAVRRSSTQQISGYVNLTQNSAAVTGVKTKFSVELKPGDDVVIRGMSYTVQSITSDSAMFLYPEYRGTSSVNATITKTINTKIAQSSWNIDRMDGTGASGFNLDLTKMQMYYIDYTWYGAGSIRYGFKNNRGEVVYCHRIVNNNVNNEAYMRSGNLPARYETSTRAPVTFLTATLSSATTTGGQVTVSDTSLFPSSGTIILTTAANTGGAIEFISYSSKSSTTFTIASRGVTAGLGGGTATPTTFTVTGGTAVNPAGTAPVEVRLHSPQCASVLSHWGSSVIMDGKFDDDKQFVFNVGMTSSLQFFSTTTKFALISIRLAPTVDSGVTGVLGQRELINRMQLTLRSMGAFSTQSFRVELLLNPIITGGAFANFQSVGGSSLAQVAYHGANTSVVGGESIFGFYTTLNGATSQELNQVRDLATNIIGGAYNNIHPGLVSPTLEAVQMYPDGPDIVVLAVTPTVIGGNIQARLSWTEAQA